jgi:hypothetical protein
MFDWLMEPDRHSIVDCSMNKNYSYYFLDRVEPNMQMLSELFDLWNKFWDQILFYNFQSKIYQQLIEEDTHQLSQIIDILPLCNSISYSTFNVKTKYGVRSYIDRTNHSSLSFFEKILDIYHLSDSKYLPWNFLRKNMISSE